MSYTHPSQSLGACNERGGEDIFEYIQIYGDMYLQIYVSVIEIYYPSQGLRAGDERGGEEEEAW